MTNKILLDTSYLLPILGVEIKNIQAAFEKIISDNEQKKVKLYFSRISLFEALGKISKIKYDETRVKQGLEAILESEIIEEVVIPIKAYLEAMKLKNEGFNDFIDLLLFETARANQIQFLTRDRPLQKFVSEKTQHEKWILLEKQFLAQK